MTSTQAAVTDPICPCCKSSALDTGSEVGWLECMYCHCHFDPAMVEVATPPPGQPEAMVEGMAEALRGLLRLDQSKEPAEEFRIGRQALSVYDSRERAPSAPVPEVEYVLVEDMVEGSHPKYGKGLFATYNCVKTGSIHSPLTAEDERRATAFLAGDPRLHEQLVPAPVPGGWRPIGEAQTLACFILENADKFQWSLQGLGMLRLYLPGAARLHVWDTRFAFPGASPVHDHLQWGLTSTILSGKITNYRYKEGSGEPFHWARFKAGYNAKQLHAPETMLLERQPAETYRAGDSYSQAPNEIHETQAEWGTVTLMQKRPTADGETARIFWPAGTEWGSAEPRVATLEEVRAITSYALAHFQPLPEPPAP